MLARREHDFAKSDHSLLFYSLSDYCERLLPDVAIGDNAVRAVQIELVDLFLRHELIDLDRAFAFDRDRLEFLGIDLEVLVPTDSVAFDDVIGVDFFFGIGIDLAVFDPMTSLFVDLMKLIFSRSDVAGKSAIGHETSDNLR